MKYCSHCGNELLDEAVICPKCGCMVEYNPRVEKQETQKNSGLKIAAKVFMIISTVFLGFYIIPLAWCLPMTISYSRKVENGESVSLAFKICSLIFVNTIAGILMLCDNE